MRENNISILMEQQFGEVIDIILQHKSRATATVNKELLLTAWYVGSYVSAKFKSEEWGNKVVSQLSEYIRSQYPAIKGYSRRNIYNMVMFYEEYSSETFIGIVEKYLNAEFVQAMTAQIEIPTISTSQETTAIVQSATAQIVQQKTGQMPKILELTTLTNHIEILCRLETPSLIDP